MRTAWRMHSSLITGSMPGIAASTSETCEFGSPPNAVEAPENSFASRGDLGVDLEPDDDLPVAGGALRAVCDLRAGSLIGEVIANSSACVNSRDSASSPGGCDLFQPAIGLPSNDGITTRIKRTPLQGETP